MPRILHRGGSLAPARLCALCALAVACVCGSPALAQESKAKSCLRTKVWEGYADGWKLRTMSTSKLEEGSTRNYLVTFYPNKEYKLSACGDDKGGDLDLLVYDLQGKVVERDPTTDRQPELTFQTDKASTYYIVVHARDVVDKGGSTWTALAVTYR